IPRPPGSTLFPYTTLFRSLEDMINTNSTVCLTLAGAMTPIGLGRAISAMIEKGFIDWIVATGANVYHDLHFAYGLPVRQGHFDRSEEHTSELQSRENLVCR